MNYKSPLLNFVKTIRDRTGDYSPILKSYFRGMVPKLVAISVVGISIDMLSGNFIDYSAAELPDDCPNAEESDKLFVETDKENYEDEESVELLVAHKKYMEYHVETTLPNGKSYHDEITLNHCGFYYDENFWPFDPEVHRRGEYTFFVSNGSSNATAVVSYNPKLDMTVNIR